MISSTAYRDENKGSLKEAESEAEEKGNVFLPFPLPFLLPFTPGRNV